MNDSRTNDPARTTPERFRDPSLDDIGDSLASAVALRFWLFVGPVFALVERLSWTPADWWSSNMYVWGKLALWWLPFLFVYVVTGVAIVAALVGRNTWRRAVLPIAASIVATTAIIASPMSMWHRAQIHAHAVIHLAHSDADVVEIESRGAIGQSDRFVRAERWISSDVALVTYRGRSYECRKERTEHEPRMSGHSATSFHVWDDWFYLVIFDM